MSMRTISCLASLGLLLPGGAVAHHVSVGSSAEYGGPILTVSPDTLNDGQWAAGIRTQIIDFDPFSDAFLEDVALAGIHGVHNTDSIVVPSLSLSYGITRRLEVTLKLPYFSSYGIREAHAEEDEHEGHDHVEVEILGDSHGIGDLVAFGKYRFLEQDHGLRMALLGGLQMPSGDTAEEQDDGRLFEAEFQPGTGAWSPMVGLSVGRNSGPLAIDANVFHTFAGTGTQDTDLGDIFAFNAAVSYRFGGGKHDHGPDESGEHHHAGWTGILEINGEWQERERIGDEIDVHSGGTRLFITPGIRYNSRGNWGAFLSVGFPVLEDLNGIQNETDFRGSAGLSWTF